MRTSWRATAVTVLCCAAVYMQGCAGNQATHRNAQERVASIEQRNQELEAELAASRDSDHAYWVKALDHRDDGEWKRVLGTVDGLLARWPDSSLASDARELRTIAVARIDQAERELRQKREAELQAHAEKKEAQRRAREGSVLELTAVTMHRTTQYVVVEGMVRNISDGPLDNVMAIVLFFDSASEFVTSDSALIEYVPLMPGQASSFKIHVRWKPTLVQFRVEFKELAGPRLRTYPSFRDRSDYSGQR